MSYAIAEAVAKLAAVGYVVNQMTDYAVWVDFSGHVDSVNVRVSKGKPAEARQERVYDELAYLDVGRLGRTEADIIAGLAAMQRYLNGLVSDITREPSADK